MSTMTFLGTSGGSGTTTLAALSLHLLAEGAAQVPSATAEDVETFNARLGMLPRPTNPAAGALVDGGRYAVGKTATALRAGWLVLVGAGTPRGILALEDALDDIAARFGQNGLARTLPVHYASFGHTAFRPDPRAFRIPFDRALAPGGPVSEALPRLRGSTAILLRRKWLPFVQTVYSSR